MAEIDLPWCMYKGVLTGHFTAEYIGDMVAEDILKFRPEIRPILDEIAKMGWRYLYIVTKAKAIAELDLSKCQYHFDTHEYPNVLKLILGSKTLEIDSVPEVEEFTVNVSTKSYPRAATVDISKGLVTYLHDPFWGWKKGWEKDPKKLAEAKEVYEVARWLLEVRKLSLAPSLSMQRYDELSQQLQRYS